MLKRLMIMAWGVALFGSMVMAAVTTQPVDAPQVEQSGQIAIFNLAGSISELPTDLEFSFDPEPRYSLQDMVTRFGKIAKDSSVRAVVLTFEDVQLGWAQMQEFREGIRQLRAADKDVYCYLEEATAGQYMLATAASRICMMPTGGLQLTGIHAESLYFKGLLDKVGVEADIEHMGDYKGAGEPFTRTGPSPQAQEMMDWLLKDLFEQMVKTIADGRRMEPEAVRELVDQGPFTAQEALAAGLVDEVSYVDTFSGNLRERYGQKIKLTRDYGAKKSTDIDFSNPFAFFKLFSAQSKSKKTTKPSIALVILAGTISSGRSESNPFGNNEGVGSTTVRRVLQKAAADDMIKAVVLRVNSPGGSAMASDVIWHAVRELDLKKPVVVSMGDVAASGGYYISAGARAIFAEPGTLTGSIGVIGGKVVLKGLLDWIGVSVHEDSLGAHADLYSNNSRFNDTQRGLIRKEMQEVYDVFRSRVTEGRGGKLKKDIDRLAGGRVYTGQQALELGLVDRLGGLSEAIQYAAAEVGISQYDIRILPEPENFFDTLFRSLSGQDQDNDPNNVQLRAVNVPLLFAKNPLVLTALETLRHADAAKANALLRSLYRIQMLTQERVLAITPAEILIR